MASIAGRLESRDANSIVSGENARILGAIITLAHKANGQELVFHEEGPLECAVLGSIARLCRYGVDLRDWRVQCVSTPRRVYRDLAPGAKSKYAMPCRFEGKTVLQVLASAGRKP